MEKPVFDINYLSDLSLLKNLDTKALEQLVVQYPYFQTANLLLAKHYYENKHPNYDGFLKKASAIAIDRAKLYEIIHEWEIDEQSETMIPEPVEEAIENSLENEIITTEEEEVETEEIIDLPKDFDLSSLSETLMEINSKATHQAKEEKLEEADKMDEEIDALIDESESAIETIIREEEKIEKEEVVNINAQISKDNSEKKSFLDWIATFSAETPVQVSTPAVSTIEVEIKEEIIPETTESTKEEDTSVETASPISYPIELPNKQPLKSFVDKKKIEAEEQIIDQFIELDQQKTITPKLNTTEHQPKPAEKKKSNSQKEFGLVSETLAIIHAKQGKIEKAIELYEQLILQEPKKSTYFVGQIEKLKNLL